MTQIPELTYKATSSTRVLNGSWPITHAGTMRITLAFVENDFFRYLRALEQGEQIMVTCPNPKLSWDDVGGEFMTFLSKDSSTPVELKTTATPNGNMYELTLDLK